MSSDVTYQMDAAALIAEADKYQACASFQIETDGSRHHCAECEQGLTAHVVVALRDALKAQAASMWRDIAGIDDDPDIHTDSSFLVWCPERKNRFLVCRGADGNLSHFGGSGGLLTEVPTHYMPRALALPDPPPPCPSCDDTGLMDVTYNSDPTNSRTIYCDACDKGKAMHETAVADERGRDEDDDRWR